MCPLITQWLTVGLLTFSIVPEALLVLFVSLHANYSPLRHCAGEPTILPRQLLEKTIVMMPTSWANEFGAPKVLFDEIWLSRNVWSRCVTAYVLIGIRTKLKPDIHYTAAELVYGSNLRTYLSRVREPSLKTRHRMM